jgi:hypothetical protein
MRIGLVGFTHHNKTGHEERFDISAALALAATVAGEFSFRWAANSAESRRRMARGFGMSRPQAET